MRPWQFDVIADARATLSVEPEHPDGTLWQRHYQDAESHYMAVAAQLKPGILGRLFGRNSRLSRSLWDFVQTPPTPGGITELCAHLDSIALSSRQPRVNQELMKMELGKLEAALYQLLQVSLRIMLPPALLVGSTRELVPSPDALSSGQINALVEQLHAVAEALGMTRHELPGFVVELQGYLRDLRPPINDHPAGLAEKIIRIIDSIAGLWGYPDDQGISAPIDAADDRHVLSGAQRMMNRDLLDLLHEFGGLTWIPVHLRQPFDPRTMRAKRSLPTDQQDLHDCVAEVLAWGYLMPSGDIYRKAEVVIFRHH